MGEGGQVNGSLECKNVEQGQMYLLALGNYCHGWAGLIKAPHGTPSNHIPV